MKLEGAQLFLVALASSACTASGQRELRAAGTGSQRSAPSGMLVRGMIGLGEIQVRDVDIDSSLGDVDEVDDASLPVVGAAVQRPMAGRRLQLGLEGGFTLGWEGDVEAVVIGSGAVAIAAENDFVFADLFGGAFAQLPLGERARLYGGGAVAPVRIDRRRVGRSDAGRRERAREFFTILSGWAADGVLSVAAASLNGLKNQSVSAAGVTPADPGFVRALELLREIQLSGAVGMRIVRKADQSTTIVTFRTRDVSPETLDRIRELRTLLRLDPDAQEVELVYSAVPASGRELAVLTNSMLHIMMALASFVEVPAEDVEQGRATPGWESRGGAEGAVPVRIRCSAEEPADAFVAVEYRERWFWIDDRDIHSKRALALLMLLFTLADTGQPESLPLITIPAQ